MSSPASLFCHPVLLSLFAAYTADCYACRTVTVSLAVPVPHRQLHRLNFAYRNLISSFLNFSIFGFLRVFPALNASICSYMGSDSQRGCKSRISAPAYARYVVGLSIRSVHCQQNISNLPSKRSFSINRILTNKSLET